VAVVVVVATVQTSAGIVTLDTLVATAVEARQLHIIVLHTEQVAEVELVSTDKVTTVLAVAHLTATRQVQADNMVQTVLVDFQASHGLTETDTDTTAAATMAAVEVVVEHHTVEVGVAKELYVSFGLAQLDNIQTTQVNINYSDRTEIY
jgi:hypothetical protein